MRFSLPNRTQNAFRPSLSSISLILSILFLSFIQSVEAIRQIGSKSLATCMDNSGIGATTFDVLFTPDNSSFAFNINGVSTISGNVTVTIQVLAYGMLVVSEKVDGCSLGLTSLCPVSVGSVNINSNVDVPTSVSQEIPGIAYEVPDVDIIAKIWINDTDGNPVGCVEAFLYNGKTVDQKVVGWVTAIIAGGALLSSAVASGLGHSNTAAHVASVAVLLFGYFQAVAIAGMVTVPLPPIVAAWTQNFQWAMGIIKLTFMQTIFTWYIKSTGGTPSTLLLQPVGTNVIVEKRGLVPLMARSLQHLRRMHPSSLLSFVKRQSESSPDSALTLKGLQRVAYRAGIEQTNLFMTGYAFFIVLIVGSALGVLAFRGIIALSQRWKWMQKDRFYEFRNGWRTVLKGIMFRLVLVGYTQMTLLCLWELSKRDSVGAVVNAVLMFLTMTVLLFYACYRVIRLARRSISLHQSAASILYSDPQQLNRWGFLYVQFRADAYYYILPLLIYALIKGALIAFMQPVGTAMVITVFVIEVIFLGFMCWIRPYMNKQTNGFGISIASINAFNMLLMIFFSDIFGLPGLANGILGVVWFVVNAVFALVLLILVIVSVVYALFSKDPETRYQPMRDDRSSFLRNAKESSTELDALAANVRGDGKENKEWNSDRPREGAQSPEEQYGRFRPMSQNSSAAFGRPITPQANPPFAAVPQTSSPNLAPGYGRSREYSGNNSRGPSPNRGPAPVRGPRDYEGYSNTYGVRSESPVPRPPGSSGGDMWKRGVGFD